ncbi:MAG TPA: VOC family protein [Candidatus Dormibacteraeota bacterium]
MTAQRIDHVGITTSDLDRSLHFYVDVLGLKLLARHAMSEPDLAALLGLHTVDLDIADLDSGDGRIVELIHYRQPEGTRVSHHSWDSPTTHIAFTVDDMAAVEERMAQSKVQVISHRKLTIHDPGGPWDGAVCLYLRDPYGTIIELVQRRPEA